MRILERRMEGRKTMSEDQNTTDGVTTLEQLLVAIRDAVGALGAQAEQIGQMQGMFGDEDGAIQNALDDGEAAQDTLRLAETYVESLIAGARFGAEMEQAATAGAEDRIVVRTAEAAALTAPMPDVATLLSMRDDVVEAINEATSAIAADEDADPNEVRFGIGSAESLVKLLEGAARSAATPIEIAIHVDGGAVQGVTRMTEETRPASIYVHDHDTEGHGDADGELARIRFDNAKDEDDLDECVLAVHTGGTWEIAPGDGSYWTTLRAEAARLDRTS